VEAHRGNSIQAPENTLTAVDQAIAIGVDRIEIDVMVSKDGIPLVIHDDTVDRTTNGSGQISEMSFAGLRRLDASSWKGSAFTGEKIPSLDEDAEIPVLP
jgi:glycerophosphoryl diester phosphodiesterase